MDEACREKIVSENYADLIWQTNVREEDIREIYPDVCAQRINDYYTVFYADRRKWTADRERLYEYSYDLFPTLYTTLQTENLEASGILALQNQPVLNLRGQGVLLGFIDTGIDYRNRCFLDNAGKSRILAIWDQTDQNGTPPEGIHYGSVYTKSEINGALSAEQPYETVPTRDISGHGTKLASIAAGSENRETGWIGAAPLSSIAMVKLKPAKRYLKEYFLKMPSPIRKMISCWGPVFCMNWRKGKACPWSSVWLLAAIWAAIPALRLYPHILTPLPSGRDAVSFLQGEMRPIRGTIIMA